MLKIIIGSHGYTYALFRFSQQNNGKTVNNRRVRNSALLAYNSVFLLVYRISSSRMLHTLRATIIQTKIVESAISAVLVPSHFLNLFLNFLVPIRLCLVEFRRKKLYFVPYLHVYTSTAV